MPFGFNPSILKRKLAYERCMKLEPVLGMKHVIINFTNTIVKKYQIIATSRIFYMAFILGKQITNSFKVLLILLG